METEKILVEEFVYEKVLKSNVEINIPTTPIFFQESNHRVITGVFPQKAEWDNNKIWQLKIIELTDKRITNTSFNIDSRSLSNLLLRMDMKGKSSEDYLIDEVIRYLKDHYGTDKVSFETFKNRLESLTNQLSLISNMK